jgi:hypothetical protein
MAVNKSQISYGFWLGIGLLLALLVWGLLSMFLGRAVGFGRH